jgi:predicted PurR-regulated permease PerM
LEIIQGASTNLAWILVILVTTFYLLQDWHLLRDWLIGLAPGEYAADARRLYEEVKRVWNSYLRGQLVLMLIIGILTGIGLAGLGIPGAATLGILAGILDAILSVGPVVAMIVAAVAAWVSGSSFIVLSNAWMVILVIALFVVIQVAENVWLRPRVIGQWVHLHPAVIFVAVMGSLALAGVLVTLIIIPVLSSAGVIGRYIYCKIFDIDPWPDLIHQHVDNKQSSSSEMVAELSQN